MSSVHAIELSWPSLVEDVCLSWILRYSQPLFLSFILPYLSFWNSYALVIGTSRSLFNILSNFPYFLSFHCFCFLLVASWENFLVPFSKSWFHFKLFLSAKSFSPCCFLKFQSLLLFHKLQLHKLLFNSIQFNLTPSNSVQQMCELLLASSSVVAIWHTLGHRTAESPALMGRGF